MKQDQQKQLEQNFQKQQNFFYQSITTRLKEILPEITDKIIVGNSDDDTISRKQFEIFGCLSYLVGIDFVAMPYLKEDICKRVAERFKASEINKSILSLYVENILKLNEEKIREAKENMINGINKDIVIPESRVLEAKSVQTLIKGIFHSAIVPVNMVMSAEELIKKQNLSHGDVLKINSLITRQIKLNCYKTTSKLIQLNNTGLWQEMIKNALVRHDNQKLGLIYQDSILSVIESFKKHSGDVSLLVDILSGDLEDFDFVAIEAKYNTEKTVSEIADSIDETQVTIDSKPEVISEESDILPLLSEEEMSFTMKNDPSKALYYVLSESLGHEPKSKEEFIAAIEKLIQNEDFSQHIFQYIRTVHTSINSDSQFFVHGLTLLEIVELLKEYNTRTSQEYKELTELICKDIPEELNTRIVNYVNTCIKELILVNDDQKSYLISQLIENGISTYNHLQQIISLIETCDINGANMLSYYTLRTFMADNTNLVEIYGYAEKIQPLETQMTFVNGLITFYRSFLPKQEA